MYLAYLSESPFGNLASPTFANQSLSVEISLNPEDVSGEHLRFDPLRAGPVRAWAAAGRGSDGLAIVAAPAPLTTISAPKSQMRASQLSLVSGAEKVSPSTGSIFA
jgi:hypothetical protein